MTTTDRRLPDTTRDLALRAALADPDRAATAWRELTAVADLADLWDGEVYRLLPMVWRNLGVAVGAEHEGRLKGLYRKSWVQNQHLLRTATEIVERFDRGGIDSLLLKGVPLTVAYYGDEGARPMGDVDLLVRPEQVEDAFDVLDDIGYAPMALRPADAAPWEREGDTRWFLRNRHARGFGRGPLDQVDLHWVLSADFVAQDSAIAGVDDLFEDARPVTVKGFEARTLSPTHHLLHAVVHGLTSAEHSVLRWITDALTILRVAGDEIDGDVLAAAAARHHCALTVRDGLDYLTQEWGAPVPPAAPVQLARVPVGRRERLLRWVRRRAGRRPIGGGYAAGLFITSTSGLGPLATIGRLPGFLADHWNVARYRHLPLVLAHKLRPRSTDAVR